MKRYETLEAIKMGWVTKVDGVAIFFLPAGAVAWLLIVLWRRDVATDVFITMAAASLAAALIHHLAFYRFVRCPVCHQQLNRFKNGKNVPMKQAYIQLGNGFGCRHCGWKPAQAISTFVEEQ